MTTITKAATSRLNLRTTKIELFHEVLRFQRWPFQSCLTCQQHRQKQGVDNKIVILDDIR